MKCNNLLRKTDQWMWLYCRPVMPISTSQLTFEKRKRRRWFLVKNDCATFIKNKNLLRCANSTAYLLTKCHNLNTWKTLQFFVANYIIQKNLEQALPRGQFVVIASNKLPVENIIKIQWSLITTPNWYWLENCLKYKCRIIIYDRRAFKTLAIVCQVSKKLIISFYADKASSKVIFYLH